ncbi:putative colanic acid biosysnthesis UDP-glucose lipid carrier transferase [Pseudoalteromonas ulvae UL12]|uniref:undecaprenyl-phosphate glucose phosphotransferase n=1 Tax=Pseudoalteromonas ulvae TaxID=107327 RepID=UPI00186B8723|nr:undecaprenyl-phosphate glucose phosphotransferase [Pseudoalteromonas ulvae]MBE0363251.1 putative colanic acid biosysnthesis UDP-glucose lipid carrier transferase [Pseudoalteromonas ulvae UL12]
MNRAKVFKSSSKSNSVLYRIFDISIITFSLTAAAAFYGVELNRVYLTVLLVVLLAFSYLGEAFDLYRSWRAGKFRHMVLFAWGSLICSFLALLVFAFAFKFSEQLSRVVLTLWFANAFAGIFAWRLMSRLYKVNRRKLGLSMQRVAVIGATESGANVFKEIIAHDELGYECIGFFEDRQPERLFEDMHLHVAGSINEAVNKARRGEIDVLFIALPFKAEKRIADILSRLGDTTVDVHFVPDFLLSSLIHARIDHVGDIDTLSVFESPFNGARELIKRTEDIIIGGLILLLISPILVAISIAIKATSKGPVFFKQARYGLHGEKIKVWKFRSMTVMENSDVVTQATKNDSRITPLGGFLRRTSLDELPQFINVILGDMSIVGPRPHAVSHNEEYRQKVEFYMLRHKVKPGITGWAQISGWRGETDTLEKMEKRIEFDLQYIKHWSLWFDLKIIFLTIFKGFTGKNAY